MEKVVYLAPATNLEEQTLVDEARKTLEAAGLSVVIGKRPKRRPRAETNA